MIRAPSVLFISILLIGIAYADDVIEGGNLQASFNYRDDGLLNLTRQGETIAICSEILTGYYGMIYFIRTPQDYTWTRERRGDNFYYDNHDENIRWQRDFIRGEDGVKVADRVTNNLPLPIYNAKLWYACTVPEHTGFYKDGKKYTASFDRTYHFTDDQIRGSPEILVGNGFRINYADIAGSDATITDLYLGNASRLGYDNQLIFAIGTTKNNGTFPSGYTYQTDPYVYTSSLYIPDLSGSPYNQWTNCDNARTNKFYATETTIGENCTVYNFDITETDGGEVPDNAVIQSMFVYVRGANTGCFGSPTVDHVVNVYLSLDGGTTHPYYDQVQWTPAEISTEVAGVSGWFAVDGGDDLDTPTQVTPSVLNNNEIRVTYSLVQDGDCSTKGVSQTQLEVDYVEGIIGNTTSTNNELANTTSLALLENQTMFIPFDWNSTNIGDWEQSNYEISDDEAVSNPSGADDNFTIVSGKYGNAMYVPENGEYHANLAVHQDQLCVDDGDGTWAFWYKPDDTTSSFGRILYQQRDNGGRPAVRFRVGSSGTFDTTLTDSTLSTTFTSSASSSTVNADEWNSFVFRLNSTHLAGFMNGVQETVLTWSDDVYCGGPYRLGRGQIAGFFGAIGAIDHFYFEKRAWSYDEILDYNNSHSEFIYRRGERNFTFENTVYDVMNFTFQRSVLNNANLSVQFANWTGSGWGAYTDPYYVDAGFGNYTITAGVNKTKWNAKYTYWASPDNQTSPEYEMKWYITNGSSVSAATICTYDGAMNCEIDCGSDVMTDILDIDGKNVDFVNAGTFTVSYNIINWKRLYKEDGCTLYVTSGDLLST